MAQFASPNGVQIVGTLETLTGRANAVEFDPVTGEPSYEGGTTIFWDDQKTVERDGKTIYLDEDGDEWTFDQLKQIEEVECDA